MKTNYNYYFKRQGHHHISYVVIAPNINEAIELFEESTGENSSYYEVRANGKAFDSEGNKQDKQLIKLA